MFAARIGTERADRDVDGRRNGCADSDDHIDGLDDRDHYGDCDRHSDYGCHGDRKHHYCGVDSGNDSDEQHGDIDSDRNHVANPNRNADGSPDDDTNADIDCDAFADRDTVARTPLRRRHRR